MAINLNEVRRIAELAHIEFDSAGLEQMSRELSKILDYIDQLKEVPVADTDLTAPTPTPMREDLVETSIALQEAQRNAPAFDRGFFVVPRVIGGEP